MNISKRILNRSNGGKTCFSYLANPTSLLLLGLFCLPWLARAETAINVDAFLNVKIYRVSIRANLF